MASVLLASCQSLDKNLPADWSMRGSLVIRTPEQAERVSIAWRQYGEASEILLTGPLGASIARITGDEFGFSLERPGAQNLNAANLESLMALALGQSLPMQSVIAMLSGEKARLQVPDWMLETVALDDQGRAKRIEIQGPEVSIRLTVRAWR